MTDPLCRFCRTALGDPVLDLGRQPLSNAYITAEDVREGRDRAYPLRLRVCEACSLAQVDGAVTPEEIFDADYAYFSSYSDSWLAHSRAFARGALDRFHLGSTSLVVEVASNDGYLLQYFVEAGVPVLGVEPTPNTAKAARAKGVRTEVRFFDGRMGRDLAHRGFAADLIHAANVLAHVPDIGDFVAGFPALLKPQGTLTLEFPHLLQMMEKTQFDTIYHEHFTYLSCTVVSKVLAAVGLRIYDIEHLSTHGGSVRLYCAHQASRLDETSAVKSLMSAESAAGLDRVDGYIDFAERVGEVRRGFQAYLADARRDRRRIAAYGAAAKGNTFLNFCETTREDIICVFDLSPHKQGKFLPGSHIPILDPVRIAEVRPDDILILPWNLKAEIVSQIGFAREWGCRFLTAVPRIEIET